MALFLASFPPFLTVCLCNVNQSVTSSQELEKRETKGFILSLGTERWMVMAMKTTRSTNKKGAGLGRVTRQDCPEETIFIWRTKGTDKAVWGGRLLRA